MPDAPVTVDVSTFAGPWPGLTISGITGTGAAALNGNYRFRSNEDGGWEYDHVSGNGSMVRMFEEPTWTIELELSDVQFEGDGPAPWSVGSWSIVGAATGTPALARWAPPPFVADAADTFWPGFTISGATGAEAANVNGDFVLTSELSEGFRFYRMKDGTTKVRQRSASSWDIVDADDFALFTPHTGAWPWLIDWETGGGSVDGPLTCTRLMAPPQSADVGGAVGASPATATLTSTGTNNDILVSSVLDGRLGNSIRIRRVNPGTNNAALSISITGRDITINLATDGSAQPSSTANQVNSALSLHERAPELINASNAVGNNGTGIVAAGGWQNLTGGTGGLPLPPVTVDI